MRDNISTNEVISKSLVLMSTIFSMLGGTKRDSPGVTATFAIFGSSIPGAYA